MKKRIRIKWVVLGVVVALFLWLVGEIIVSIPVYPAFQKQVGSYAKLRDALKEYPEVCIPDPSMLALTDVAYDLQMDGRTILSRPEGYSFGGSTLIKGLEVSYGLVCDKNTRGISPPDTVYRGIPLKYHSWGPDQGTTYHGIFIQFFFENHYYSFGAYYNCDALSEEEISSLEATIKSQSLELAQQVIDCYLDKE